MICFFYSPVCFSNKITVPFFCIATTVTFECSAYPSSPAPNDAQIRWLLDGIPVDSDNHDSRLQNVHYDTKSSTLRSNLTIVIHSREPAVRNVDCIGEFLRYLLIFFCIFVFGVIHRQCYCFFEILLFCFKRFPLLFSIVFCFVLDFFCFFFFSFYDNFSLFVLLLFLDSVFVIEFLTNSCYFLSFFLVFS